MGEGLAETASIIVSTYRNFLKPLCPFFQEHGFSSLLNSGRVAQLESVLCRRFLARYYYRHKAAGNTHSRKLTR